MLLSLLLGLLEDPPLQPRGRPTAPASQYPLPLVYTDLYWFLLVVTTLYWFLLVSTGFYWFPPLQILHYSPEEGQWVAPGPFFDVLSWNGSRGTRDLQDLSVWLAAVGRAHAGHYVCGLRRNLTFEGYTYSLARNQSLRLAVVEPARRDLASIVSEILMYVLIVVLTLWLAAEMLYCYRKVAAAAPPPDSA
ncbi:PREDICTED: sodium channel subunit beta-1-like [Sturnus vulgaris]|uniref:sodium channel subunit beta-1-like n=1 Tax=Sturnus vulgaris TaxID=9172 RepID=UPI00071A390A|nr:PREDICTED: sodium channel subunit beta-1-like [Sturnus vulgaris]